MIVLATSGGLQTAFNICLPNKILRSLFSPSILVALVELLTFRFVRVLYLDKTCEMRASTYLRSSLLKNRPHCFYLTD